MIMGRIKMHVTENYEQIAVKQKMFQIGKKITTLKKLQYNV